MKMSWNVHGAVRSRLKQIIFAQIFFLAAIILYYLIIFGSLESIIFCCDASFYIVGANEINERGILNVGWIGYRSYLNYGLTYIVKVIGSFFGADREVILLSSIPNVDDLSYAYSIGAFVIFGISGTVLIWRFAGYPGFFPVFISVFCNPFLFVYVPYPLQEGQAVLFMLPLAVWAIFAIRNNWITEALIAAALLCGISWMIKSSYLFISLVTLLFIVVILRKLVGRKDRLIWTIAAAFLVVLPILPQVASSIRHASSVMPYTDNRIFSKQLAWGWSSWRYDTYYYKDLGQFGGLHFPSPFAQSENLDEGFDFYDKILTRPLEVVALAIGHTFAAFNYANIKTYNHDFYLPALSWINLIVGATLFSGLSGILLFYLKSGFCIDAILIDGIALANAVILPFIAVESRFSIISFAFITMRAMQLTELNLTGTEKKLLIFGASLFAASFALIGTLMFQTTGLSMVSE